MRFLGFDHVDTRVASLAAVEPFYDRLMPKLGLTQKRYAYVDGAGDWHDASADRPYNTVEYSEIRDDGRAACFIGFIEDPAMHPVATRIAFIVERASLPSWVEDLRAMGARKVEPSSDLSAYPAIFFEDPAGTRLEICGRG
ncbi:MAG: glyoxalase [Candidatus Eremiobacteraeota bacterium]|nr:glyoxalase [Candidatus Eremiobacteraeota bacterium]